MRTRRYRTRAAQEKKLGDATDACVYCGQPSCVWDHVIPFTYAVPTPLCLAAKFTAIHERIRKRYWRCFVKRKWTPPGIHDDLSPMLEAEALAQRALEEMLARRLSWVLDPHLELRCNRFIANAQAGLP